MAEGIGCDDVIVFVKYLTLHFHHRFQESTEGYNRDALDAENPFTVGFSFVHN